MKDQSGKGPGWSAELADGRELMTFPQLLIGDHTVAG